MPSLEQIIRPFVVMDTTPPAVAQTAPAAPSTPTTLNIGLGAGAAGGSTTMQQTSGSYSRDWKKYMTSVVKEKKTSG
jgi:hypothetical protein